MLSIRLPFGASRIMTSTTYTSWLKPWPRRHSCSSTMISQHLSWSQPVPMREPLQSPNMINSVTFDQFWPIGQHDQSMEQTLLNLRLLFEYNASSTQDLFYAQRSNPTLARDNRLSPADTLCLDNSMCWMVEKRIQNVDMDRKHIKIEPCQKQMNTISSSAHPPRCGTKGTSSRCNKKSNSKHNG